MVDALVSPMHKVRYRLLVGVLACSLIGGGIAAILPPPYNPYWQLFSGYYRYDPRHNVPLATLMRTRPEDALRYYLDATLAACKGRYLPVSDQRIQRYELGTVEYWGKGVRATSAVHTRLYFADGQSQQVTFHFEATHNEWDVWYLDYGSSVRVTGWRTLDGLLESPAAPPPGRTKAVIAAPQSCEEVGLS